MKQSGTCAKCGGAEVVRVPGGVGPSGVGNYVAMDFWSAAAVTRFVCTACGYCEEWIESPRELEKLKKKFGGGDG